MCGGSSDVGARNKGVIHTFHFQSVVVCVWWVFRCGSQKEGNDSYMPVCCSLCVVGFQMWDARTKGVIHTFQSVVVCVWLVFRCGRPERREWITPSGLL